MFLKKCVIQTLGYINMVIKMIKKFKDYFKPKEKTPMDLEIEKGIRCRRCKSMISNPLGESTLCQKCSKDDEDGMLASTLAAIC